MIQRALILLNGDQIEVEDLCFELDVLNSDSRPAVDAVMQQRVCEDDALDGELKIA